MVNLCLNRDFRFCFSLLDTFLDRHRHKISDIYKPLVFLLAKPICSRSTALLEQGPSFHRCNTTYCILAGYNTTCAFITNEFWWEQQFKIMHQAYIPHLRTKQLSQRQNCPLCGDNRPSIFHRLWSCRYVSCFWGQIESFAATVTGYKPHRNPFCLLFGLLDDHLL